ncbi:DEKNAAC101556 [Brettanomyces naardenensis]|uniref:DEKNAAC101556 n=1 Tax=Brettanomyces naardenensis TaxID=13370 RepID=A0A448YIL1_BRENA|nr:DEKNAAC101556 [Brettanomyces naardenensis]
MDKLRNSKLPRATLKEKIEVLDYIAGPPKRSQLEALAHFKAQKRFAISQATLSNWTLKERQLRAEFLENPNLEDYRKKPVLKHPEVTKAVEKYVEQAFKEGQAITDNMIKKIFVKYLKEYGYTESDFKISGGMLHSFKKRNFISGGRIVEAPKRRRSNGGGSISSIGSIGTVGSIGPIDPLDIQSMPTTVSSANASANHVSTVSSVLPANIRSPETTTTSSSSPFTATSELKQQQLQQQQQIGTSQISGSDQDLDINFDDIFNNPIVGFNTRLIHSDDSFPNLISGLSYQQPGVVDSLLGGGGVGVANTAAPSGNINVGIPPMMVPPNPLSAPDPPPYVQPTKPLPNASDGTVTHPYSSVLFGNYPAFHPLYAQTNKNPQSSVHTSPSSLNNPAPNPTSSLSHPIPFRAPSVSVMTRNTSTFVKNLEPDKENTSSTAAPHNLPYYPSYQSPMQYQQGEYNRHQRPYVLENFAYSRSSHPNSEKVEKILENITEGYVTIYNSGTSAIMGILSYLNPPMVCINNSGYQGTHQVIKLLRKLTGTQQKSLDEVDQLVPKSVVVLETPMNPEGYLLDIANFAKLAHEKQSFLLVDSTLAPPPLQFPFKHGADYIVYSAVKYLAGVSDLSAGFVVSRHKSDMVGLHSERFALGTNIANFDSFLLLRSLRTYRMRILTQCSNTKKVLHYLQKHLKKYQDVVTKLHHSSLQTNNDCFRKQLNGYYNPVFAIQFKYRQLAETVLTRFNFLSNNPNLEGGETLVELTFKNPNFQSTDSDDDKGNLLRFSIGCEDYADIIRDIDQAIMSVIRTTGNGVAGSNPAPAASVTTSPTTAITSTTALAHTVAPSSNSQPA